ncbi:MAG: hypothetical protein IPM25_15595 [Chloracidobacterium sp.]|nr:hypothetical protein [Chloracidobacterium sp.]
MNKIKGLVATAAFSLLILGLPAIASAQWGGYPNNGGYYGNYNIKSNVKNLKERAKDFEKAVDRFEDRSDRSRRGGWGNSGGYGNYGGYGNNGAYADNLERLADQFKDATDRLEDKYGNGRNLNNSADEARRVLDLANRINTQVNSFRGNNMLAGQWNRMRNDLNAIANVYGYNRNMPRNNRNGNWRNNIPFPFPF